MNDYAKPENIKYSNDDSRYTNLQYDLHQTTLAILVPIEIANEITNKIDLNYVNAQFIFNVHLSNKMHIISVTSCYKKNLDHSISPYRGAQ